MTCGLSLLLEIPDMRNIRLIIEYEGTNYSGWQRQKNGLSVQEVLEKALAKIACERVSLKGASRTDAGVHALGQVANFKTNSDAPLRAFSDGLNSLLPDDIGVIEAIQVEEDFDAIKSSVKKDYRYCIRYGRGKSVFARRFSWYIWNELDTESMKLASQYLIGKKDFMAFQGTKPDTKTTLRNLISIEFSSGPFGILYIDFTADGFLKYMVRNMVGTLIEVGLGKRSAENLAEVLESKDRKKAGQTAPAHGLFLLKVHYLS